MVAARSAAAAAGVAVVAVLSRQLGPTGFGELSLVFTVAVIASSLAELGATQVVVGEMAARPVRRRELAAGFAVLRAASGAAAAAMGTVLLLALLNGSSARWAGVAVMASLPLAGSTALAVLAQARLRPQIGAYLALGQSALWLAAVVVAAAVDAPLAVYGVGFLVAVAAQAVAAWLLLARPEPPAWRQWRAAAAGLLRRGWPLAVTGVLGTVYYRLDGVLVFHLAGAAEAGFYAAAYRFLDVLQIVPAAVVSILLPLMARGWVAHDPEAWRGALRLGLTAAVAIGVPVGVGAVMLGDRIAAAAFGSAFTRAGEALSILGLAFLSIACGYVYSSLLIAAGRVGAVAVVSAAAVAVSVVADLLVIPRWGAVGAAWVTVGVEYFVSTSLAIWISRRHGLDFPWDRLRAAGLAAAAMAGVAWSLANAPLPVVLPLAALTYVLAALALGVFSRDELRALADRQLPLVPVRDVPT